MTRHQNILLAAGLVLTGSTGTPGEAQIPIRELAPAQAVSADTVGFLYGVRELSDGRLLVNDAGARRILLLDRDLRTTRVVADSGTGTSTSYGRRPAGIIPYLGDSTLLVDLSVRAFLVIDPQGAIVRVMSAPRPADVNFLWNPALGTPTFDPRGRLIYRGWLMPQMRTGEHGIPSIDSPRPDSAPILRGDFDARTADTLGWVRVPRLRGTATPVPGGLRMVPTINPVSVIDDWAALPDGSVAILRGQDYHVDWIGVDGSSSSSPKMPFDWKRITQEEKVAIVDSTRQQLARQAAVVAPSGAAAAAAAAAIPLPNPMMATPHTMPTAGGAAAGDPAPRRQTHVDTVAQPPDVVTPDEIPDYMPPVLRSGNMKSDPEGNVWVLPSTSAGAGVGGLLYDVINRQGEIFQRVRLPIGRALEGFGAGGVIYLTSHGLGGTRIERSRLR